MERDNRVLGVFCWPLCTYYYERIVIAKCRYGKGFDKAAGRHVVLEEENSGGKKRRE